MDGIVDCAVVVVTCDSTQDIMGLSGSLSAPVGGLSFRAMHLASVQEIQ
jgi:hypothetical protein